MAVFVGAAADKRHWPLAIGHWLEVGRCCERFALQATAPGIRNALLNQPVEVAAAARAAGADGGLQWFGARFFIDRR